MSENHIVGPDATGKATQFFAPFINLETVANELELITLGDFEPLDIKIDCAQFMTEIANYHKEWVDYLPRTDRPNNRKGLALSNLPGKSHRDNPSIPQASLEMGRRVHESEFNEKTQAYHDLTSLHPILEPFQPLGRSFLVKSDMGGFFVPHRDHPGMPRESFRIVVFLNNCAPLEYDWLIDTDRKLQIEQGRAYYINTKKTHRTISWVNDSIHLIINVPFTSSNVSKLVSHLQHRH